MCLDLEIRRRTANRKSLDDVMRHLWMDVAQKGRTLEEDDLRPIVERVAGGSYRDFFDKYVDGTTEVPFETFLRHAGLELAKEPPKGDDAKDEPKALAWLGIGTRANGERPSVSTVAEGSPAWRDGLSPGDEIVAVDGAKATAENFSTLLKDFSPGTKARITVFRGPRLVHLPVTFGRKENVSLAIRPVKRAGALEKAIHRGWLRKKWETPKKKSS
jgi:predicted metalloprotease with PDZ domain